MQRDPRAVDQPALPYVWHKTADEILDSLATYRPRTNDSTSLAQAALTAFLEATPAPGALLRSDRWRGYWGLGKAGYDHRPRSRRAGGPGEREITRRAA